MQTAEYKDHLETTLDACESAAELRAFAAKRRADAAVLSALYRQVEDMQSDCDKLALPIMGQVEEMRCDCLQAAEDAEKKAEQIEIDEEDERLYGGYAQQVASTYYAGIGSL